MANILKRIIRKLINKVIQKNNNKILSPVTKVLQGANITLVDIGAADGVETRWKKISPVLSYIGFEPDERSDTDLTHNFASSEIYRNAVWDQNGTFNINLTSKPQVSSYFTPNKKFVDLFPDSERFNIERVIELQSVTLDSMKLKNCDFIKLDIQGGELNVLKGAENTLKTNIGLEIEVEFSHIYNDQPLFGAITDLLQLHGYYFIDFVNLNRWERNAHSGFGQCVFGDALFLKMPENIANDYQNNDDVIAKYLAICLVYHRFDLIDVMAKLVSQKQNRAMEKFLLAIKPIRAKHKSIRRINAVANSLMRLIGGEDYKSHVIY